jgi:tRNA threonylcarbamoyl adenosine modification protein YjeE
VSGAAAVCFALPNRRATRRLGRALAAGLAPGDAVILNGALGAGKTFLVRALCRALGLDPRVRVVSPTFTLIRELDTVPPIAHVDLYRLEHADGIEQLGLRELRDTGHALIVEWGERHPASLGPDVLTLSILLDPRRALLSADGPRAAALLAGVQGRLAPGAEAREVIRGPGDDTRARRTGR